jgi:hypothetical protein
MAPWSMNTILQGATSGEDRNYRHGYVRAKNPFTVMDTVVRQITTVMVGVVLAWNYRHGDGGSAK